MKKSKNAIALMFCFVISCAAWAQSAPVEMADALRAEGKIYAVVTGLVVILAGLIFFLLRIERKLVKVEREVSVKK